MKLSAQSETDGGEGAVISDLLESAHVVAAVHRIKEKVCAIPRADFDVVQAIRHAGKPTDIGNDECTAARGRGMRGMCLNVLTHLAVIHGSRVVIRLCVMSDLGALPPKQHGYIRTVIEHQLAAIPIADKRRRAVPRKCWADAVEFAVRLKIAVAIVIALAAPSFPIREFWKYGSEIDVFIMALPIGVGSQRDVGFVVELGKTHAEIDLRRATKQSKSYVLAHLEIEKEMRLARIHLGPREFVSNGSVIKEGKIERTASKRMVVRLGKSLLADAYLPDGSPITHPCGEDPIRTHRTEG